MGSQAVDLQDIIDAIIRVPNPVIQLFEPAIGLGIVNAFDPTHETEFPVF